MLTTNNYKIILVQRLVDEKKITITEAFALLNEEATVNPWIVPYVPYSPPWPPVVTCGEGGLNNGGAVSLTNTDKIEFVN